MFEFLLFIGAAIAMDASLKRIVVKASNGELSLLACAS
jgi:hypothetical protein